MDEQQSIDDEKTEDCHFLSWYESSPPPLGMKRRVANEYQARACSALA